MRRMSPPRTRGLGSFLAGYAGLAGFFAIERVARQSGAAASLSASGDDQGTTRRIVGAYVGAAALSPLLRGMHLLRLPEPAGRFGLAVEGSGLALRTWSMHTLGDSYTRTLRTGKAQQLVESGPYRLVRHPGYAGSLLTWAGFALASRSLPVVVLVTGLLARAYRDRIRAEEELLGRVLPGYADYARRTWRLVPYLW
jgi:protein-S-isoprenylcysteine O-methyltransferase Ste14